MSPAESTATPPGERNWALVAGLLSPKPDVPPPTTVVITPLETLRMRLLFPSSMYRLPAESTATPKGLFNWALVAGPLSPLKPNVPFPATVVITPFETLRMRLPPAMYRLSAESTATPEGMSNWALVAGPLSPLKPCGPVPATVVITPFETLRMRLPSAMYSAPAESTATPTGPNWAPVAGPLSPKDEPPPDRKSV